MSGLGELASVIAILQLSGKIVDYVGKVKDASEDRKRLRREVRACKRILQELKDDAEDIDEGESLVDTINVLERPDGPLPRLQTILLQVENRLKHDNTLRGSLKWPFQEKDVQKLIQSIEREKLLINLALSRDSRKLLREIKECADQNNRDLALLLQSMESNAKQIGEEFCKLDDYVSQMRTLQVGIHQSVARLQSTEHHRESTIRRNEALKWLSDYDHASKHHGILSKRQEGTGNWLLESEAYNGWLDKTSATKLLCTGLPGAGKTMLASIIIDDLQTRFQTDISVTVAYFYCDYRTRDEQTLEFMLSSLLKVLAESYATLPLPVERLYSDHKDGAKRPSYTALIQCLRNVAADLKKLYVVIDALDECQVVDGCRRRFLSEMLNLQASSKASLLATSRTVPEILAEFGAHKSLEVRASGEDVRKFVVGNIANMPRFVQRNDELQELIKIRIVESVQGMFLLAKLYLQSLYDKRSPNALRKALKEMTTKTRVQRSTTETEAYDYAYRLTMQRIEEQPPDRAKLGREVLAWVTCLKEPLKVWDLRKALGIQVGQPTFDEDDCPEESDMVSACCGLLTADWDSGSIHPVHYTTQEYLNRTQHQWFPEAETVITEACITYLSLDEYGSADHYTKHYAHITLGRHVSSLSEYEQFDSPGYMDRLYVYAACNWGHHAYELPGVCQSVIDFFELPWHLRRSAYVHSIASWNSYKFHYFYWKNVINWWEMKNSTTGIHLSARFGLHDTMLALLQRGDDVDAPDELGHTALMLAARNNHLDIVRLLLHQGARTDLMSDRGITLLHYATRSGNIDIVRLVISNTAVANTIDKTMYSPNGGTRPWETPMHVAVDCNYVDILQLFLDIGVDVNLRESRGVRAIFLDSLLDIAVKNDNRKIFDMLLDAGANVDRADCQGTTALHIAAEVCNSSLFRRLLEAGANANLCDEHGESVLHWACQRRRGHFIPMLVDHGAKVSRLKDFKARANCIDHLRRYLKSPEKLEEDMNEWIVVEARGYRVVRWTNETMDPSNMGWKLPMRRGKPATYKGALQQA